MMKKIILPLIIVLLSIYSCSKEEVATINPDRQTVTVVAEGGSESIAITTNQLEWYHNVTGGEGWLTVTKNINSLTIIALENILTTTRNATIVISAGEGENVASTTITINQSGATAATLSLSSNRITFEAISSPKEVTVTTNKEGWEFVVESGASQWLSSVKNGNTITISVAENIAVASRTGTITVSTGIEGNSTTKDIVVTQNGAEAATLTLEISDKEVGSESTSFTLSVTTNQAIWNFVIEPSAVSWLSVEKSGNSLIVTVADNNGAERSGTIEIVAGVTENQISKIISITQLEKIGGAGGGELNIEILF